MDELKPVLPPGLQSALDKFYAGEQPDLIFAARLEAQLRQRQMELLSPQAQPVELIVPRPVLEKHKPQPSFLGMRNTFMHTLRTRPLLAVIAALLALLLLTGITYAVSRLAGFIPGVGFVNDVQSVLATPIVVQREVLATATLQMSGENTPVIPTATAAPSGEQQNNSLASRPAPLPVQERKGVMITVEQAVSEASRLVITYKVSGLPANLFDPERMPTALAYSEAHPDEPMPEQVRLPDGTLLEHASGGGCTGGGDLAASWLGCQSIYAPLPAGVNQFTLEIHRLHNTLPGELPEDWVIPIQLSPASPAQVGGPMGGLQEPNLHSQTVNGITMRLIKASQGPAQSAFQLAAEWQGTNRMVHHTAPVQLQDDQGRYYILSGGPDGGMYSIENPNYSTLPSLVTSPIDGSRPLTFRLDWIIMSAAGQASLHVDPSTAAKTGQEWALNEKISAGGFTLNFTKARLKQSPDGAQMLEFDIQAPDGVIGVNLMTETGGSGESGYDHSRGLLVSRVTLPALPSQPLTLQVSEVLYKVIGPWEITWQPEKVSAIAAPTPAPTRMAQPAPAADQPPLAELQALLKQGYGSELFQAGWVHQVFENEMAEVIGMLDTGDQPQEPLHTRVEAWFRLDGAGYVRTTIYIRKTLDGKLLSADIDNGIYHFRLPEGRGGVGQDIYLDRPAYDMGLVSTIAGYLGQGGTLRQEHTIIDGQACRLYEAAQTFNPPQAYWGEPAATRVMRYAACIDPQTGRLVKIQGAMDYADGTSRVKDITRFISLEKVDQLPAEVRQLLDQVIMPE